MIAHRICAFAALTALLTLPSLASAQVREAGNFGIGVGSGTFGAGLSAKYFLSESLSVQGVAGIYRYRRYWDDDCRGRRHRSCNGYDAAIALSADLLSERPVLVGNKDVELAWHLGGGLGAAVFEDAPVFDLAAAFVLGLQLDINILPIDLVVEYRPHLVITEPSVDLIDFTAHIRYFF